MYGCESWTIKKTEHWRIDAFELWCCRRLLRVTWTARRSNQSILKEINPEYSLEGLMLKLKLQYFGHLKWRADSFEKTLMLGRLKAGGGGDDRGCDGWMASPTQWTWVWVNSGSWWWTGRPGVVQLWRVGHDWATELNCVFFTSPFWHLGLPMLLKKKKIPVCKTCSCNASAGHFLARLMVTINCYSSLVLPYWKCKSIIQRQNCNCRIFNSYRLDNYFSIKENIYFPIMFP